MRVPRRPLTSARAARAAALGCAALLGALAGAELRPPRARACECIPPSWTLRLRDASEDGWPSVAHLDAYRGSAGLVSDDPSGATLDYLRAGQP